MKLLSSWRRWDIYLVEENWKTFAIKKAKDPTKKWAIKREIAILSFLKSKVDFVPQIIEFWEDWFKYEFIKWDALHKIKLSSNHLKEIYKKLVNYSYLLDLINVEHWELSRPTKNIIVNFPKVYIIDFERWSLTNNKNKNLKAIWQFLLWKWIIEKESLKFSDPKDFKNYLEIKIDKFFS